MDFPYEARALEAPFSNSARPLFTRSPASNPNFSSLPPLVTQVPHRSAAVQRPGVQNDRLSIAAADQRLDSRPQSNVFPFFLSSLHYALVRDFAYPSENPLHYGPAPEMPASAATTASEFNQRIADTLGREGFGPSETNADASGFLGLQIPTRRFGSGPPYAEDEDLLSPIVTTTRHKKNRSSTNDVGSERPGAVGTGLLAHNPLHASQEDYGRRDLQENVSRQNSFERRAIDEDAEDAPDLQDADSPSQSPSDNYDEEGYYDENESRYSRHYQFSIASPDEEYHGKAVALFDFARENDNELPFREGQVLYVSYRHGEGWLVAQDPRSGESGLVPEQYVRLLRDIEGGLSGLTGETIDLDSPAAVDPDTPTEGQHHRSGSGTDANGRYFKPVVSSFSTSSKDLEPYQLGNSPQSTPTVPSRNQFAPKESLAPEILGATSFQQSVADGGRTSQ